ncbi:MAG: DUF2079 domain-containing protein [Elusimicrobiota bacterium]
MTSSRAVPVFFAASILLAAFFYVCFFVNFASTLTDWSGFGFTWTHQMFHNFLHGREFQSSLFATLAAGHSVGFSANPHAFIHADVIHVNFTPYLFAWLWAPRPTPAGIYALIFSWNLTAGAWWTFSILRRTPHPDVPRRAAFASAILAFGGLLSVLCQMAQMLLFAGPILLAAYDSFLARRRGWFLFWIALLALVSEDAAMVAVCFGLHLLFVEDEGRPYGIGALALCVPYLALILFIVQPAARAELTLTGATTTAVVAKKLFSLDAGALAANLRSMAPLSPFIPAFVLSAAWFGVPDRRALARAASLALLPALPHWGECLVVGGAHHLGPPWYGLFLALLSCLRDGIRPDPRAARWAWAAAAAFFAVGARVQAGHLPLHMKPALYRLAGRDDQAASLERSLAKEEASNRAVIEAVSRLPVESSLVFLGNNRVLGFIAGRPEIWEYPQYSDRARFLLIQKDAIDANFSPLSGERDRPVTASQVEELRRASVAGGLYRTALENEHILLLERTLEVPFESPASTIGWGWVRNIGRKPIRA